MEVKVGLKYTKDHEWASLDDSAEVQKVKVGITDYAQHELGDVVFVDLPEVGSDVVRGQSMLTVESVKAVSDVYAPISGKIALVNSALGNNPEMVNSDPFGDGWIAVIEVSDSAELSGLLNDEQYSAYLAEISK